MAEQNIICPYCKKDTQGIIGVSLPEIKSLELKALTDETEVIQAEEI